MRRIGQIAAVAAAVLTPALAHAQYRGQVPPGQMPPAGMCRIWINGVPPGRQPAPTSCAYAQSHVPRNGQVIYGQRTNSRDGRIFTSNGDVYGRQRCVEQRDRYGRLHTVCADGDHDWDDRVVARSERDRNRQRELDERRWQIEQARIARERIEQQRAEQIERDRMYRDRGLQQRAGQIRMQERRSVDPRASNQRYDQRRVQQNQTGHEQREQIYRPHGKP